MAAGTDSPAALLGGTVTGWGHNDDVVEELWAAAVTGWGRWARRRARRVERTARTRGWHSRPVAPERPESSRLVGPEVALRRLAEVRPGTLVLLRRGDAMPEVRRPGELLVPPLRPRRDPVHVRPVSTAPLAVVLRLVDLVSLDGYPLPPVQVRLDLQLDGHRGPSLLAERAYESGERLEADVLAQVERETRSALQAAVSLNRLSDLQRQGLGLLLEGRWIPAAFAGGMLLRREVRLSGGRTDGEEVLAPDVPGLPARPAVAGPGGRRDTSAPARRPRPSGGSPGGSASGGAASGGRASGGRAGGASEDEGARTASRAGGR